MVLVVVYLKMVMGGESPKKETKKSGAERTESAKTKGATKSYNKQSIFDFMDFDKIEDSMIIQKKGKRFLMAIECQGINYDLMSGIERTSVESGFQQFLNTLRFPIQIYTQTRTINLSDSLQTYKKRLEGIKLELERKELRQKQMVSSGQYTEEEIQKQQMEVVRDRNLFEYGQDIIFYTEKMSLNKSVLRKQYFIIIPYYASEAGSDLLDADEIRNLAFSELYTRAQAMSRVLSGCSISCKVLDSYELADLLYTAYNRDESETFGLDKAFQAGYDELYVTAHDVLEKKMEELEKVVEERAYQMAEDAVVKARTDKEQQVQTKEKTLSEQVAEMAKAIIAENEQYIGEDIAESAIEEVEKQNTNEGGKS